MWHKRRFGKKGCVAVIATAESLRDSELMSRVDAAALQFGITHEYAFTLYASSHPIERRRLYIDFTEKVAELIGAGYVAFIVVGPEAQAAFSFVTYQMKQEPMLIVVGGQEAIDMKAPHQFEMRNPHQEFSENWCNLVQTCLQKNISQEEGVEQFRAYEDERQGRDWGLFDDCYVQLVNRNRVTVTVRFEDETDTILEEAAEKPFVGRDRTILFQA